MDSPPGATGAGPAYDGARLRRRALVPRPPGPARISGRQLGIRRIPDPARRTTGDSPALADRPRRPVAGIGRLGEKAKLIYWHSAVTAGWSLRVRREIVFGP